MSDALGRVVPPSDGRLPVRPPFPARLVPSRLPRVGGARLRAVLGGRGGSGSGGSVTRWTTHQEVMHHPRPTAEEASPRRTVRRDRGPGRSSRLRPPWGGTV